jgi:hypothetical protein
MKPRLLTMCPVLMTNPITCESEKKKMSINYNDGRGSSATHKCYTDTFNITAESHTHTHNQTVLEIT